MMFMQAYIRGQTSTRTQLFIDIEEKKKKSGCNTSNFDKGSLDVAHKLTKRIVDVKFVELRKIHYNVMSRVMDMTDAYHHGWQKLCIIISDMLI
jgi:hypothetical protein